MILGPFISFISFIHIQHSEKPPDLPLLRLGACKTAFATPHGTCSLSKTWDVPWSSLHAYRCPSTFVYLCLSFPHFLCQKEILLEIPRNSKSKEMLLARRDFMSRKVLKGCRMRLSSCSAALIMTRFHYARSTMLFHYVPLRMVA